MSRRKLKAGSTSQTVPVFVQDTSSTTGAGLGSLVFNTSGLAAKYRREGQSSWTTISLVTATAGTWASGGFVSDGGPVTGTYEVGIPNAVLAAGAKWAEVAYYGATNMLPVLIEFELDAVDYQDGAAFGLTDFSNIKGCLPTSLGANGNMKADVRDHVGVAVRTPNVPGVPVTDQGYAAGVAVQNEDFTLASATATTITLPALNSAGNGIADDGHKAWHVLLVVGGTGEGQTLLLSTATGNPLEYTVAFGMTTPCDGTSRCVEEGTWRSNATHAGDTAWNSGAVTAAALAADCITAAKVATGAIDADALAADAVAEIWGTALTEAYRTAGATGTAAQLLYELIAHLGNASISGTTKTTKKVGGATAKTYTLNSATAPTSIAEAS